MNGENVKIRYSSTNTEPKLHIVVQEGLSQVINRLKSSFEKKPHLIFPYGKNDDDWEATNIEVSLDPDHPGQGVTEITIGKLRKQSKEASELVVLTEVSVKDLGGQQTEILLPRTAIELRDFYFALVYKLIELWPEVKRQCADFLEFPTAIEPEEVFTAELACSPKEVIDFCIKEFPGVFADFSYTIFGTTVVSSKFSFDIYHPDFQNRFWQFLVIAEDTTKSDNTAEASYVEARGLQSIAAEVVIAEGKQGKTSISLIKNAGLPLPAFAPGDSSTMIRLPYPYEEQLVEFVNKLKYFIHNTRTSSSLSKQRREVSEWFIKRAEKFKEIKTAHPEYSYDRVAMEYNDILFRTDYTTLVEDPDRPVGGEDVRNAYRIMGWKWERGWRTR